MNWKTPITSNDSEPDVIFLEVLPDRDPQPVIRITCIQNEQISVNEIAAW